MTERPETPTGDEGTRAGRPGRRRLLIVAAALLLGGAAVLAGVYGIGGDPRNAVATSTGPAGISAAAPVTNEGSPADDVTSGASLAGSAAACRNASETGRRIADFAKGELAAFAPTLTPTRIPDLAFLGPDGQPLKLSEVGGTGLKLVNIWATWCVPCREEMPALDELQAKLGTGDGTGAGTGAQAPGFSVVAVNIDTRDPEKPKRFMDETGIKHLALYTDPKAKAFQELRTVGRGFGLPTTMLIDAQGCEIGHIAGPAEWASPDALALINAALGKPAATETPAAPAAAAPAAPPAP